MKTFQALMWASAGVAVLGLLGCVAFVEPPPRRVYVAQPQPEYVIVTEPPPPIIREYRPSPPSRGHIWIDGNWHWSGKRYIWQRGHWTLPPQGRTVWVAPRYEKDQRGYRYVPGRWSEGPPGREKENPPGRGKENPPGQGRR